MTVDNKTSPCSGCGLVLPGGTAECQRLFEEVAAREVSDLAYARARLLTVDTYCLQHPDRYCRSAKSLAAHLVGLCYSLEHVGGTGRVIGSEISSIISRWLDRATGLAKPPLPEFRGRLTVADVLAATDADAHARVVSAWAGETWQAYADLHALARRWLAEALASR